MRETGPAGRLQGLGRGRCRRGSWGCGGGRRVPGPQALTSLQPLPLPAELPLLPAQQPQVVQAGALQPLQVLAQPGLSLLGVRPLQIQVPVQPTPGHAPLHPLRGLRTVHQGGPG